MYYKKKCKLNLTKVFIILVLWNVTMSCANRHVLGSWLIKIFRSQHNIPSAAQLGVPYAISSRRHCLLKLIAVLQTSTSNPWLTDLTFTHVQYLSVKNVPLITLNLTQHALLCFLHVWVVIVASR